MKRRDFLKTLVAGTITATAITATPVFTDKAFKAQILELAELYRNGSQIKRLKIREGFAEMNFSASAREWSNELVGALIETYGT